MQSPAEFTGFIPNTAIRRFMHDTGAAKMVIGHSMGGDDGVHFTIGGYCAHDLLAISRALEKEARSMLEDGEDDHDEDAEDKEEEKSDDEVSDL